MDGWQAEADVMMNDDSLIVIANGYGYCCVLSRCSIDVRDRDGDC
jgi:hypothetical protein